MSAGALVAAALTTYRLSTFVTTDTITRPWRHAAATRWPPGEDGPHWFVELVNCGRCVGWWLAGPTLAAVTVAARVPLESGRFAVGWVAVAGAVTLLVSVAP